MFPPPAGSFSACRPTARIRGDLGLALAAGQGAGGGGLPDGRFGDYYRIRPASPCGLYWTVAAYALSGGTSVTNVNARQFEFGRRERDRDCWEQANT
jgi:hypothetical protein